MEVLVCVKRVPATGGRVTLTEDQRAIDTKSLGFTVSPHEECAVEEAVRIVETHGGSTAVLTLGPDAAEEQLRSALALGADRGILLETDEVWGPMATAEAITTAIQGQGSPFDLLLFGNEAADSADHQVGIRVAHALDLPCVVGVKSVDITDGRVIARREGIDGVEIFEVDLPAVLTIREGINVPRYPSVPGRIRAKKAEVTRVPVQRSSEATESVMLVLPPEKPSHVQVLGNGPEAASAVVDLLIDLKLVSSS